MTTFYHDFAQVCPHCQAENPWDAKVCLKCKNVIKVTDAFRARLAAYVELTLIAKGAQDSLDELFDEVDAVLREGRARDGEAGV